MGLPGSSTDLSARAVLTHPGGSSGCIHPLLPHRWQASTFPSAWPHPICLTRPKQVRFTTAHAFVVRGFGAWITPGHRPIDYMANGHLPWQLPFKLQGRPGLAWRTGIYEIVRMGTKQKWEKRGTGFQPRNHGQDARATGHERRGLFSPVKSNPLFLRPQRPDSLV